MAHATLEKTGLNLERLSCQRCREEGSVQSGTRRTGDTIPGGDSAVAQRIEPREVSGNRSLWEYISEVFSCCCTPVLQDIPCIQLEKLEGPGYSSNAPLERP